MSGVDPTGRPPAPIADELDPALDDRQIECVWRRLDTPRPGPRLSTPLMWAAAGCLTLLVGLGWWRDLGPGGVGHAPGSAGGGPQPRAIAPESAARPKPSGWRGTARPDDPTSSVMAPGVAPADEAASPAAAGASALDNNAPPRAVVPATAGGAATGSAASDDGPPHASPGRRQPTPEAAPSPHSAARPDPRRAPARPADARGPADEPSFDGLEAGAAPEVAGSAARETGARPDPPGTPDEALPDAALAKDPLTAVGRIFDEYGPSSTASAVLLAMSQAFISSQPAYAARLLETGMARGFPANPAMHVLASDAWAAAGDPERAARAARRALRGAPDGPHAERMRRRSVPENPAR